MATQARATTDATAMPAVTQCVEFRDGKRHGSIANLDRISETIGEHGSLVWLDLLDPTEEDLKLLQAEFDLHPLAIEDARTPHERPKIEQYANYLFLVVHPITWQGDHLVVHEMAIFAGHRFLVTIRHEPAFALDEVEKRWRAHDGEIGIDCGFMLYVLLDTLVDGYFPISDRLEERISELQTGLFESSRDERAALREIFDLKNDVHHARRSVVPMRELLQPLVRGDLKFFERDQSVYYRDVYDHAIRVIDQLDSARDLVNSALEVHISLVANRQNEVAKQLAVIATIFLPLTYLTGFFGQNFGFMVNRIVSPHTFWFFGVGSQLVGLCILLFYFRVKRWF